MKLVTAQIRKKLEKYPLRSQDGKKAEALAVARFFFPVGAWTWYILEADLQTDEAFGVVINGSGEGEFGYFSLKELQTMNVRGLGVERDICFNASKLKDIKDENLHKLLKKLDYE